MDVVHLGQPGGDLLLEAAGEGVGDLVEDVGCRGDGYSLHVSCFTLTRAEYYRVMKRKKKIK